MTRRVERSLWLLTALFGALAIAGWRSAGPLVVDASRSDARRAADGARASSPVAAAVVATLAESITARDPFRLDRRPSAVGFGAQSGPTQIVPDQSRRPQLLLSGVFGPPWQAVLEGIPGRDGSVVVRVGDVFGELRVRSIRRDTVVVQGADTTWKLTVRHLW